MRNSDATGEQLLLTIRSVATLLLRQGVTAHEFAQWANEAFVLAAIELLREQGADPSFSRISAMTGLHRHAVSALLGGTDGSRPTEIQPKEYQRHRLARVLTGWFEDPEFTGPDGRPLVLPPDGSSPSFAELVRAYSGDIYPGIILEELLRVGAVRQRKDGALEARSRRYVVGGSDSESLKHADVVASDVLRSLEHNICAGRGQRFFEDGSIANDLSPDVIPRLSRLLERRATAFLDDLEGWLDDADRAGERDDAPSGVRAGVRVIMVVDPPERTPDR
jgi:hypothetical protein